MTPHDGNFIGVLHPQLQQRFAVQYDVIPSDVLTRQTVSCELDFVKKRVTLHVEQASVDMGMMKAMVSLCHTNTDITILSLDGADNSVSGVRLNDCDAIQHTYKLSYADSGVATHIIILSFDSVSTLSFDQVNLRVAPVA